MLGEARIVFTPQMTERFRGELSGEQSCDRYATIMRSGTWDPGIWPLVIFQDGTMLNGFTRMEAVRRAGCSVEFNVRIVAPTRIETSDGIPRAVHRKKAYTEAQVTALIRDWCGSPETQ